MIRILLVDDHAIVREGFKRLVEREGDLVIVAEAASEEAAVVALEAHSPDMVITDLSLLAGGGLNLLRTLSNWATPPLAIVLSMHDSSAFVAEAFGLGAKGYVTKASAAEELVACIRAVLAGQRYLSEDLRSATRARRNDGNDITARERDTLRLIIRGLVPKAAAAELGISEKTLYAHRASLMEKLGARSERDLVILAVERGLD